MPFYRTGTVQKLPIGQNDIDIVADLLGELRPEMIFAAGDLSDPHGTHRTCLSVIFQAMNVCADRDWYKACQAWLYRGAWQEWMPEDIEMAVPLSPMEVARKRAAVFHHESQKDRALFPGTVGDGLTATYEYTWSNGIDPDVVRGPKGQRLDGHSGLSAS